MARKGRIVYMVRSRAIRLELGRQNKTQEWLAQQMRVSPQYVSQLMNHVRATGPKTREKIEAVITTLPHEALFERIGRA